jgi:peroxiredoxin
MPPTDTHDPQKTHQYAKKTSRSRTPLIIGVVLALMALIGVIAVLATNSNESKDASPYTPTSTGSNGASVTGTNLPTFTGSGDDAAVGKQAPAIEGTDFEGRPVKITDDGRPKVILFLAHWCPHCQREVATLSPWLNAGNAPEGVDVYSVSTAVSADRPNYPPQRWLEAEKWPVPVVSDTTGRAADAYGLSAFPFWTLVDAKGQVVMRFSGEASIDQVDQLLTQLAAG